MLYLFSGEITINEKSYKAYYLYAAATLKTHRGRGIMAEMLAFANKTAKDRNVDLICLKPATRELYEYYGKFGYKTVFSTKTVKINADILQSDSDLNIEKCNNYCFAREKTLNNFAGFIWDKKAIDFAVEFHKFFDGSVFENRNGFCLYSQNNGVCYVKEFCFTPSFLLSTLRKIIDIETKVIKVDLPVEYPIDADNYEIKPNGMAYAISEKAAEIYDFSDLYLNLTLD